MDADIFGAKIDSGGGYRREDIKEMDDCQGCSSTFCVGRKTRKSKKLFSTKLNKQYDNGYDGDIIRRTYSI